jgi:transposase
MSSTPPIEKPTAIRVDLEALLVSLELSTKSWLVTSISPGQEKMSRHTLKAGDGCGLVARLEQFRAKAEKRQGNKLRIITIQEAGLDGFWLHRLLEAKGIESHVVDAASIAVSRRHRRAKTDKIDGEALLRTLLAWLRGEPRVCSMVRCPSVEEEDAKRLMRERASLLNERIQLTNSIIGLLASQGVQHFSPLRKDAAKRLEALKTGDGRAVPPRMINQIRRSLERIAVVCAQIKVLEKERDDAVEQNKAVQQLMQLKSVGSESASVLWLEALYRQFPSRRHLASYAGLAGTPYNSGKSSSEQGINKSGNAKLRTTMVELAWQWLRYQPGSALSRWFAAKVGNQKGKIRRIAIVALARKLLVALWHYVNEGVIPEGAVLKAA